MVRSNRVFTGTLFLAMFVSTFASSISITETIHHNNPSSNSVFCDECENVFTKAEDVFKSPKLIDYTLNLVEELVCDHLSEEGKAKCNETMAQRIPDIFNGIASHWLDPTTDCEELHLCHNKVADTKEAFHLLNENTQSKENDLKCDICTKVIDFIGDEVIQNEHVQSYVTEELDIACGLLPKKYSDLCEVAANSSVPEILSYISTFVESNGCSLIGFCDKELTEMPTMWNEFHAFIKEFDKVYETTVEFMSRFEVFRDNAKFIAKHSSPTLQLKMNEFGDMTPFEFGIHKKEGCFLELNTESNGGCKMFVSNLTEAEIPASIDWRTKGAVTPIKDQGQCGSCWSFSATGSMEGAYFIKTGKLLSLSEQELVDCSGSFGNQGCNGGLMDSAFEFALEDGMCTETEEPYKARDMRCAQCAEVAKFQDCFDVPTNDEEALMKAVAQQPVSVAIEADNPAFMFYSGGIIEDAACGTNLDHGVLAVGYGEENGKKFWIIKNSWGTSWGENGYVRIARDETKKGAGICGIAMQPSFITA